MLFPKCYNTKTFSNYHDKSFAQNYQEARIRLVIRDNHELFVFSYITIACNLTAIYTALKFDYSLETSRFSMELV